MKEREITTLIITQEFVTDKKNIVPNKTAGPDMTNKKVIMKAKHVPFLVC